MRCDFLNENYRFICQAMSRDYFPSSFEVGEYCSSGRNEICPLHLQAKRTGKRPGRTEHERKDSDSVQSIS